MGTEEFWMVNGKKENIMLWPEIRKAYPKQWLIVEALEARTAPANRRRIDRMAVIEKSADGSNAMKRYRELHKKNPFREFYFVHTDRDDLNISDRNWTGIRRGNAADTQG
ncbi:MAG: hypothetical protein V2B19_17620 [Pseudomonadota bacterium]